MSIGSETFNQALRSIDSFLMLGNDRANPIFPQIFSPLRARQKSDHVEVAEFGSLGLLQKKLSKQSVTYTEPNPGYSATKYYDTWALALRFDDTFVEDEKIGLMGKYVERLGGAVRYTQEYQAAQVFNSGDATTYHSCSDGLALFDDTHKLTPTGPATYDTLATAATLSATSLQAALTQVDTRTDDQGLPTNEDVVGLIHPPALQWKVAELLKSTHSPEDSRRAVNPVYELRDIKPIKWKYLTGTNNWYLVCKNSQTGLYFVRRSPVKAAKQGDFGTGAMLYKVRTRYLFLTWHPRGVLANIP